MLLNLDKQNVVVCSIGLPACAVGRPRGVTEKKLWLLVSNAPGHAVGVAVLLSRRGAGPFGERCPGALVPSRALSWSGSICRVCHRWGGARLVPQLSSRTPLLH